MKPFQYAGCYSLHLYCDRWDGTYFHHDRPADFPDEYTGGTFAECARAAKARGWKIHRATRTATCPLCVNPKDK